MSDQEDAELKALAAELAQVESETATIERRREPTPKESLVAQIAKAKRAREDAETMEKLEQRYGKLGERLARALTPHGMIVVQTPNSLAFKIFSDSVSPTGGASTEAVKAFVERCLVYPTRDEFRVIVEQLPGVIVPLGNALQSLGGAVESAIAKKA